MAGCYSVCINGPKVLLPLGDIAMNRRDLLKALAASGAVMTLPTNLAWAASQASPDRFLVILSAGGGWDVR